MLQRLILGEIKILSLGLTFNGAYETAKQSISCSFVAFASDTDRENDQRRLGMNLSVPFALRRVALLLEMTTFEGLQDVVHRDALDDILEFIIKLNRLA